MCIRDRVASMSMELLTQPGWDIFYEEGGANRARRAHLEGVIFLLPWIATIDSFQHWVYANPGHSREEREDAWIDIRQRFGSDMDWSNVDDFRGVSWQVQGHLYGAPFYYIEYGIAQLGSLQLWQTHRKDRGKALDDYANAMKLGNTKPLPELFSAADLRLGFSEEHLSPLIEEIGVAMQELA